MAAYAPYFSARTVLIVILIYSICRVAEGSIRVNNTYGPQELIMVNVQGLHFFRPYR